MPGRQIYAFGNALILAHGIEQFDVKQLLLNDSVSIKITANAIEPHTGTSFRLR